MDWIMVWMESHSGTASWAQAIGTVVALAIAVAIPLYQHQSMKRQATIDSHEQAIQLFDSLGAMADFAGQIFGTYKKDFDNDNILLEGYFLYEPHTLAGLAVDLDRFPIYQLPDYDSVSTALEIKAYFLRTSAQLERSVNALRTGEAGFFAEETEGFRTLFEFYSEAVASFSAQASAYRQRIQAS